MLVMLVMPVMLVMSCGIWLSQVLTPILCFTYSAYCTLYGSFLCTMDVSAVDARSQLALLLMKLHSSFDFEDLF